MHFRLEFFFQFVSDKLLIYGEKTKQISVLRGRSNTRNVALISRHKLQCFNSSSALQVSFEVVYFFFSASQSRFKSHNGSYSRHFCKFEILILLEIWCFCILVLLTFLLNLVILVNYIISPLYFI